MRLAIWLHLTRTVRGRRPVKGDGSIWRAHLAVNVKSNAMGNDPNARTVQSTVIDVSISQQVRLSGFLMGKRDSLKSVHLYDRYVHELKERARMLNEQMLTDQDANMGNCSTSQPNSTNDGASTDQSSLSHAIGSHLHASFEGIPLAPPSRSTTTLPPLVRPLPTSPSSSNRNGNFRHRSASSEGPTVRTSALSPASVARSPSLSTHSVHTNEAHLSDHQDSLTEGFFGRSYNLSFMQTVQTSIPGGNTSTGHEAEEQVHGMHDRPQELARRATPLGMSAFSFENSLPQRSVADHLVDCYMENVHILYPFLHEPSFRSRYEEVWTSKHPQDVSWLCLLNIVFALGTHFSYNVEDSTAISDRFYNHSKKLLSLDELAEPNVEKVQLLLLTGLYLQSTSRPNQCWNIIGLTARIAPTIGLHLDPLPSLYNPLEVEIRRRCWWGCFLLDR